MPRPRAGQMSTEVLSDWSRGEIADIADIDVPPNGVLLSTDFLFDTPGVVYKRGGSAYASDALTGAAYAKAVAYAPFTAGTKIITISEDAHRHFYTFTPSSSTVTDVATLASGFPPIAPPVFFNNLLIIPAQNGTTSLLKYDGSAAPSSLAAGSSPASKFVTVWLSRVVGAGGASNPRRVFFSPTPNPDTAWDTTNAWLDSDFPVTALAATQAGLLIFSEGAVELVTGTTPPPGSNLSKRILANIGCTDARSVAVRNNRVIFANQSGLYMTDGASEPIDLCAAGGVSATWMALTGVYSTATHVIAGGMLDNDHYYVNIWADSGASRIGWIVYFPPSGAPVWQRVTNHAGYMFASSTGIASNLYMADRLTNRVAELDGFLAGSGTVDADADVIRPILYSSFVGKPGLHHFDRGRITYRLEDDGAAATLDVRAYTGGRIESDITAATLLGSLPHTSLTTGDPPDRTPFDIAQQGFALGFILRHGAASSQILEISSIEVDLRPFPVAMVA